MSGIFTSVDNLQICQIMVILSFSIGFVIHALAINHMQTASGKHFTSRNKRIIGGSNVKPNSMPWLGHMSEKKCAAFLVDPSQGAGDSSDLALTAAHCVFVREEGPPYYYPWSENMRIYFGKHKIDEVEPSEIEVHVAKAIVHPQYFRDGSQNDIAVLKLRQPIKFNNAIRPIIIANSTLSSDEVCFFGGWGGTATLGMALLHDMDFDGMHYSAALKTGNATKGDSGGPLVCGVKRTRSFKVRGVSSLVMNGKVVFSDLTSSLPWILNTYQEMGDQHFYEPTLKAYDSLYGPTLIVAQTLMNRIYAMNGFIPEKITKKLQIQDVISQDYFLQELFQRNFKVVDDRFYTRDLVGYSTVRDAHSCAIVCWTAGYTGPCSFVPSMLRCYISDTIFDENYSTIIPKGQSVMISMPGKTRQMPKLASETNLPTINNFGVIDLNVLPLWSISISAPITPGYHCTGQWVGNFKIEASTACLKKLLQRQDGLLTTVNIIVLGEDRKICICEGRFNMNDSSLMTSFYEPNYGAKDYPPNVDNGVNCQKPKFDFPATKNPAMVKYQPLDGGFIAEPYSLPWLVEVRLGKVKKCLGVLLNEFSLIGTKGRVDRTRFVLTTQQCINGIRLDADLYVYAGNYYPEINGRLHQTQKVVSNASVPKPLKEAPAILELAGDIFFNGFVKPLLLDSNSYGSLEDTMLYSVHWQQIFLDAAFRSRRAYNFQPQRRTLYYSIPQIYIKDKQYVQSITPLSLKAVHKAEGAPSLDKIVTERTFFYPYANRYDLAKYGDPLIHCVKEKVENQCKLLGFFSNVKGGINAEEWHMDIRPHVGHIRHVIYEKMVGSSYK